MSRAQRFRGFVSQRLDAAVQDILAAFEKIITKYEQEAALSQEVISRQHALLCALNKQLTREAPAGRQPLQVRTEGLLPQSQDQVGEQLQDLDETEIIQFTYNSSSSHTATSGPGPGPAGPDVHLVSSETEDSEDYSDDTGPPPVPLNLKTDGRPGRHLSCRVCGRVFRARKFLIRHARGHLQEAELVCGLCGKRFEAAGTLKLHFLSHLPGSRRRETWCPQNPEPDPQRDPNPTEHGRKTDPQNRRRLHRDEDVMD